jgi:hypothetical protein
MKNARQRILNKALYVPEIEQDTSATEWWIMQDDDRQWVEEHESHMAETETRRDEDEHL